MDTQCVIVTLHTLRTTSKLSIHFSPKTVAKTIFSANIKHDNFAKLDDSQAMVRLWIRKLMDIGLSCIFHSENTWEHKRVHLIHNESQSNNFKLSTPFQARNNMTNTQHKNQEDSDYFTTVWFEIRSVLYEIFTVNFYYRRIKMGLNYITNIV